MKKHILIVYNPNKQNVKQVINYLCNKLQEYKISVCSSEKITEKKCVADLIITLGGDGTILKIGPYAVKKSIPVAGVNIGGLGYLAEFKVNEIVEQVKEFFDGKILPQNRLVLEILYKNKIHYAINDCVIKNLSSKVCNIELFIDNERITQIIGDGLIIATPTGSTAYSLACGGSIVEPKTNVLLITPISPHTLSIRTIIVSSDKKIMLKIPEYKSNKNLLLTLDGQRNFVVNPQQIIKVYSSIKKLLFIPNRKKTFFKILTQKLSWGKR